MCSRTVSCVDHSGVAVAAGHCGTQRLPAFTAPCNTQPCPALSWRPSNDWSPCSSPCISTGVEGDNGTTLGVSTSSSPLCVLTDVVTLNSTIVDAQQCVAAGLTAPSSTVPCNRFVCPQQRTSWWVGPWSGCYDSSAAVNGSVSVGIDGGVVSSLTPLTCGTGRQWRAVACQRSSISISGTTAVGVTEADSACVGDRPGEVESCDAGMCTCASDVDCATSTSSHPVCSTATAECGCESGWAGVGCDIPLQQSSENGGSCVDGLVDVTGQCCGSGGVIDAVTGLCCGDGVAIDGDGRCCSAGQTVDACGVCGGNGFGLDVNGACCSTVIAPSGECCVNATLDDCGVCGGTNQCEAVITTWLPAVVTSSSLAAVFGSVVNFTVTGNDGVQVRDKGAYRCHG